MENNSDNILGIQNMKHETNPSNPVKEYLRRKVSKNCVCILDSPYYVK